MAGNAISIDDVAMRGGLYWYAGRKLLGLRRKHKPANKPAAQEKMDTLREFNIERPRRPPSSQSVRRLEKGQRNYVLPMLGS